MPRDTEPNPRARIWPRDKSGTPIEQDLVDAAERNWARFHAYSLRHQQDSSRTADILEATLLALSRARKTNARLMRPIRNLDNYLYSAFVRCLNRRMAREPKIEPVGSLQDVEARASGQNSFVSPTIEDELLVDELMTFMDEDTRRMFTLRKLGYSWKAIARILNTTANNAQVRYDQGLKRARYRLLRSKDTSGKGGETHD